MLPIRRELPGPRSKCRCRVCVLSFERTEGAYREIVVYGLGVQFVKLMQESSRSAMLD